MQLGGTTKVRNSILEMFNYIYCHRTSKQDQLLCRTNHKMEVAVYSNQDLCCSPEADDPALKDVDPRLKHATPCGNAKLMCDRS